MSIPSSSSPLPQPSSFPPNDAGENKVAIRFEKTFTSPGRSGSFIQRLIVSMNGQDRTISLQDSHIYLPERYKQELITKLSTSIQDLSNLFDPSRGSETLERLKHRCQILEDEYTASSSTSSSSSTSHPLTQIARVTNAALSSSSSSSTIVPIRSIPAIPSTPTTSTEVKSSSAEVKSLGTFSRIDEDREVKQWEKEWGELLQEIQRLERDGTRTADLLVDETRTADLIARLRDEIRSGDRLVEFCKKYPHILCGYNRQGRLLNTENAQKIRSLVESFLKDKKFAGNLQFSFIISKFSDSLLAKALAAFRQYEKDDIEKYAGKVTAHEAYITSMSDSEAHEALIRSMSASEVKEAKEDEYESLAVVNPLKTMGDFIYEQLAKDTEPLSEKTLQDFELIMQVVPAVGAGSILKFLWGYQKPFKLAPSDEAWREAVDVLQRMAESVREKLENAQSEFDEQTIILNKIHDFLEKNLKELVKGVPALISMVKANLQPGPLWRPQGANLQPKFQWEPQGVSMEVPLWEPLHKAVMQYLQEHPEEVDAYEIAASCISLEGNSELSLELREGIAAHADLINLQRVGNLLENSFFQFIASVNPAKAFDLVLVNSNSIEKHISQDDFIDHLLKMMRAAGGADALRKMRASLINKINSSHDADNYDPFSSFSPYVKVFVYALMGSYRDLGNTTAILDQSFTGRRYDREDQIYLRNMLYDDRAWLHESEVLRKMLTEVPLPLADAEGVKTIEILNSLSTMQAGNPQESLETVYNTLFIALIEHPGNINRSDLPGLALRLEGTSKEEMLASILRTFSEITQGQQEKIEKLRSEVDTLRDGSIPSLGADPEAHQKLIEDNKERINELKALIVRLRNEGERLTANQHKRVCLFLDRGFPWRGLEALGINLKEIPLEIRSKVRNLNFDGSGLSPAQEDEVRALFPYVSSSSSSNSYPEVKGLES